ncbi:MAG: hypothetical protein IKE28_01195 [Solobacterium sp.]|nr:hypothetical protein [Solobacterium sp.]
MLGFAKGYILRNVTAKTKGIQVFYDDVNVMAMTNKAAAELPQHIENGEFIAAVYKKDKLKGYYRFRVENTDCSAYQDDAGSKNCCMLKERYYDSSVPNEAQKALDDELVCSLMEDIPLGKYEAIVFENRFVTIDRSPIIKAVVSGILFGLCVGVIIWFLFKNTAMAVIIGLLWIAATIFISVTAELNKQKNLIREEN